MLYHIVTAANGKDDALFKRYIEYIKHLYFPVKTQEQRDAIKEQFSEAKAKAFFDTDYHNYLKRLKDWGSQPTDEKGQEKEPTDEEVIKDNKQAIDKIQEDMCEKNPDFGYPITNSQGDIQEGLLKFPFIDRFHEYFLRRQWNYPERGVSPRLGELSNFFRLYPQSSAQSVSGVSNYSQSHGDYNHFVNVVAALARSIHYFQETENVKKLIGVDSDTEGQEKSREWENNQKKLREWANNVVYQEKPDLRKFKLMLAAFYHDIGKTIANPRHGMEGSLILGFHTSKVPYCLNQIVQRYDNSKKFERNDLLFIAELLNYHDKYGTLSTGEDGYLQLIEIIESIKRYSVKHEDSDYNDRKEQIVWSQRYLFDLWLLNIADIMVSMQDKWKLQDGELGEQHTVNPNWMDYNKAREYIEAFLGLRTLDESQTFPNPQKSNDLKHDLIVSFNLLEEHNKYKHTDNTSDVKNKAINYAKRHSVERIRRLIVNSLMQRVTKYKNDSESVLQKLANNLDNLSEEQWNSKIVSSIKTISDLQEFCDRLAWIGKMDYSLGFFQAIVSRAFKKIEQELTTIEEINKLLASKLQDSDTNEKLKAKIANPFRTNWLTSKQSNSFGDDKEGEDYLAKVQAQCFADNYVAIIIEILSYLLFREPDSEHFRNIEFSDATQRLTPEKIDKIIGLEGTYRTRKSIELILQIVTMY
jgi:hypothetical protein